MKLRIAILGNSHVAALKLGWDQIADTRPDLDLTFFAAPGRAARAMKLKSGVWGYHAKTPKPSEKVFGSTTTRTLDLGTYDFVLRHRDGQKEANIHSVLANMAPDGFDPGDRSARISRPALRAIIEDLSRSRLPGREWGELADLGVEMTQCPAPYPDARITDLDEALNVRLARWAALASRADELRWVREVFQQAQQRHFAEMGIRYLPQPEETLAPNGLTRAEFADAPAIMHGDDEAATPDREHMNASFGAAILRAYLATLPAPLAQSAPPAAAAQG